MYAHIYSTIYMYVYTRKKSQSLIVHITFLQSPLEYLGSGYWAKNTTTKWCCFQNIFF